MKNTYNNCDILSTQHDLIFSLFDRNDLSKAEILIECEMNSERDFFETASVSRRNDIHWIFATSKYTKSSTIQQPLKAKLCLHFRGQHFTQVKFVVTVDSS